FGTIMGIGFWSYITIIFKTFQSKRSEDAYPKQLVNGDVAVPAPDKNTRFMAYFFAATTIAMLIGTIQGVIQILPFASTWLDAAGQAGDMITPLAHAQINIIASIGFGLMGLVYFALPKLSGKQWMSQPLIRASFILMIAGITLYYVSLLTLGFIESIRVHQLIAGPHPLDEIDAFNLARSEVGWAHPFWLTFSNIFIAGAYITYAVNVLATLGPKHVRDSIAEWMLQAAALMDRAVNVNKHHKVKDYHSLRWRAARAFVVEVLAGWLGFLGAGWVISGRLAFGFGLLFTWFTGWLVTIEWVLSAQPQVYGPSFGFIVPLLPLYFGLPLISATCAAVTYLRRGLQRKAAPQRPASVVESSVLLIEDVPAGVEGMD
ncbi:MAG TPA: cbb3-type cytochrome c oxidase subunit I, partial [Ktedonobacterales bacterium]|nr:cbb3-type cytochrome c oxidase subunit I [Ktedonobacterales bacterium]